MNVVIVGGGFGGVRTALKLANKKGVNVKLISSNNIFEYHAALYRSATGRSPLEVAIPLKDFFEYAKNVEVLEDTAISLNHDKKLLIGESGSKYPYDELVLGLGAVTEFFGIKGLEEHAFKVKTIHEALALKRHLHEQLLNKSSDKDYVVVGAGATGVELSAELLAYLKKVRRKHKVNRAFNIDLIEAAPRPVAALPKEFSEGIMKRLSRIGVIARYNTPIRGETAEGIELPGGSIKSRTVIWTAGVANNPFYGQHPEIFRLDERGRVRVDDYLQATRGIYVIGDSAASVYSGMAQTALHHANAVADNILRLQKNKPLRKYRPIRPIYAIPVGPRWAAVLWGKTKIYGKLGWILRRLADLRLYFTFLPPSKALITWRYGFVDEEVCPVCKI